MASNDHILVVEDEEKIAELLKDYLKAASYDVSCLHDGRRVVPFVKETPPRSDSAGYYAAGKRRHGDLPRD